MKQPYPKGREKFHSKPRSPTYQSSKKAIAYSSHQKRDRLLVELKTRSPSRRVKNAIA